MPIFAFRAMSLLVVDAPNEGAARHRANQVADLLSSFPYRSGSNLRIGADLTTTDDKPVQRDLLGGFSCPIQGHVNVQAPDAIVARETVTLWKRLVEVNLGCRGLGLSFARFDLLAL